MTSTRISEIASSLDLRIHDDRLLLDQTAEDLVEVLDILSLYPGGSLDLSAVVTHREELTLTVSGTSQAAWQVPAVPGLAMSNVAATVTFTASAETGQVEATARLTGSVATAAGSWQMTAVSEGGDAWRLTLELGAISVADIMTLVPDVEVAEFLPQPLWSLAAAVKLSQFELLFSPHGFHRTSIVLLVAIPGTWDLLPDRLAISDTTFALTVVVDPAEWFQVDGVVSGTAEIGEHAYRVAIGAGSTTGFTVEIAASASDPPLEIADVGALLGVGDAVAPLQESLKTLGFQGTRLTRLALAVDPKSLAILDAEVAVEIVLRGFSLTGAIEYPDLSLRGGLVEGSVIDVKELLTSFDVPTQDLPGLRVSNLAVLLKPAARALSVNVTLAGDWEVSMGTTSLALVQVDLGLAAGPEGVRASFSASTRIAGAVCLASVSLPELNVSVGLVQGSSLDLKQLVEALLPGDITVPEAAPAIVISKFDLQAQPRQKTFTLDAETTDMWPLPFGEGLALGKLKLALAASREGETISPSASIAGTLALGGGELTGTLTLQKAGGSLSLVQGEEPISLTEIIAGFVPGGIALPTEIGGLGQLQLKGLSGSFDLATAEYAFNGEAEIEGLTLGALSVPKVTVAVGIEGTGATLDSFTVKFAATLKQDLVPALQVESVDFELKLERVDGAWKWHVGGSLVAGLLDLPKQTLRADASNGEFRFSIAPDAPLTWSLPDAPDMLGLSFKGLTLALKRDDVKHRTEWSCECSGGLKLPLLPTISGTLGLDVGGDHPGFIFTVDEDQGELDLSVPLVPGVERMAMGCKFKPKSLSLVKQSEWTLSAASEFTWVVPQPGAPNSEDPIDKALKVLGDMLAPKMTVTIAAARSGVSLTVTGLPRVPVPVPVLVGHEVVWHHNAFVGLAALRLEIGKTLSGTGKFRVELPPEINNIFGQVDGKPKTKVFNPDWVFGVTIDEKWGLSLQVESLPINLEADEYFKEETDTEGTWKRFTLGDVFSFRYGTIKDKTSGGSWIHVDLFDMGRIRFQQPSFSFNGTDFAARVNFEVIEKLKVPTAPLRWLLTHSDMQDLADQLPTHIALLDIHILDPETKTFDIARFKSTLQMLAQAMKTELPGMDELTKIAEVMAGQFNQLPKDFRDYLDVTIPTALDLSIAVTPATGLGVKFDISAPNEPLRFLIPTVIAVYGVTIRSFSFGEILSGSLLLVAADLDYDCFDTLSLVASLVLPRELIGQLTDTPSIQRKFIIKNFLCLVEYETAVPIPIPIWFDALGFKHHGIEGVRGQLVLGNNLAGITMGTLLKGLCDLFREFRRFFTEPDYALPENLFSRNKVNFGVNVKPGFVQLPKYLGGALLGSEQELFNLGVDSLLVPVVNFLKHPDIGKLLAVIPLELRNGSFGVDHALRIGPFEPQAAWLFSTTREFDGLVQDRRARRSSFVDSLYSGGDSDGNALVQVLRETASEAAEGKTHDGVVVYAMGALHVPNIDCSVRGFAGMLADRDRGLLTQFRFKGKFGSLLAVDLGGRVAVLRKRATADEAATADLSMAGNLQFVVLGHPALLAEFALEDGDFTFAGRLSLFPPNLSFKADAEVTGRISRDHLQIGGRAVVALAPLPAASADLSISYERTELNLSWLDHDWTLRLEAQRADQYVFTARANKPVTVLPGLVTLLDADSDAIGPSFELAGPRDAAVSLSGRLAVPKLGVSGRGRLAISAGRVETRLATKFHGLESSLVLRGESLDRPASFTFAAEMKGDLFSQLTDLMHGEFRKLIDGARKIVDEAEALFKQEWDKFKALVEQSYNEVRAGILDAKAKIEKVIADISAAVDGVIDSLRVNEREIAERKRIIREIKEGAQAGLQWFRDRVTEARTNLEARRSELQRHDEWYAGLSGWDRFWQWAYYSGKRLELLIAVEVLPAILRVVEGELERAENNVEVIAEGTDAFLQHLDRLRNGFLDQMASYKRKLMEHKKELDHFNDLLLMKADELLREFAKSVDHTMMDAAKKTFDGARAVLDGLSAANDFVKAHRGLPFEVQRLSVKGVLSEQAGRRFEARSDVKLNTFARPKVALDVGLSLDLDDLPATAAALAKDLWDRRVQIELVDYEDYHRTQNQQLDQEYAAVMALREQLGPEFGETLDKKLLLDMSWAELAEFCEHAMKHTERFAAMRDVVELLSFLMGLLEPLNAAVKARQLTGRTYTLLQQANPGLMFDLADPAGMVERARRALLEHVEQLFRDAVREMDAGNVSFGAAETVARPFRVADMSRIDWDSLAGNEKGLIKSDESMLNFGELQAVGASMAPVRFPCAVLFSGPDFTGDIQVLHVGAYDMEALTIGNDRCQSLMVLPGYRVKVYEHARFQGACVVVTNDTMMQNFGMGVSGAIVEAIDFTVELPAPQLAAWSTLAVKAKGKLWSAGRAVRYAIAFEYADGRLLRSGWWSAAAHTTADPDGYVTVDSFACPMLSDISRDPTGAAVARRIYRQFRGEPEAMVARIANNTDTTWVEPAHLASEPLLAAFYCWQRKSAEALFVRDGQPLAHAYNSDGPRCDEGRFGPAGNAGGPSSALVSPLDGHAELFVRGADGYLHGFSLLDGGWRRELAGFVEAGKVGDAISALFAAQRRHSEVFFRGEDGYVHYVYNLDGRWGHDDSSFKIAGRSSGALSAVFAAQRQHAELFAVGEDGYLHCFYVPNGAWAHDSNAFRPAGKVGGAVSAVFSPHLNHSEVFFRGEDGGLHRFFVAGGAWHHESADLGAGKVDGDICAIYAPQRQHSEVFFRGEDGHVHYLFKSEGTWHRDSVSFRAAGKVHGSIAAVFNPERNHAEFHALGEDSRLHFFFVEAGRWQHQVVAIPPPTVRHWTAKVPVAGSPTWRPGYGVRYAVEFEHADGTVMRSRWWPEGDSYAFQDDASPALNIPCDPSGQVVARRIVRQFHGLPERVVARIANNTDTTWLDADTGAADMPPPAPTCAAAGGTRGRAMCPAVVTPCRS